MDDDDNNDEAEEVEDVDDEEADDRMDCIDGEGDCDPLSIVAGIAIISFLLSSIATAGFPPSVALLSVPNFMETFKPIFEEFVSSALPLFSTFSTGVLVISAETLSSLSLVSCRGDELSASLDKVEIISSLRLGVDIGGMVRLASGTFGSSYIFDTWKRERVRGGKRFIDCVDDEIVAIEGSERDVGNEEDNAGQDPAATSVSPVAMHGIATVLLDRDLLVPKLLKGVVNEFTSATRKT